MSYKGVEIDKKGFTPEQTISKLREAELLLNQGAMLSAILKKIGISDVTYYRWLWDRKRCIDPSPEK